MSAANRTTTYVQSHTIAGHHVAVDLGARAAELRELLPGHGRRSETVYKDGGLTVVLMAMEPGNMMAEHAAGGTVTVHLLEGSVEVHADGAQARLAGGQLLALAPGVRHDVHALAESVVLLTVEAVAHDPSVEDDTPPRDVAPSP